jgi:hypothetical protein
VNDRVITLRARSTTVPFRIGDTRAFYSRVRPDHVEVLEPDGRHLTVRVYDVTDNACYTVAFVSFLFVVACRAYRRRAGAVEGINE